jgi:hypothetical protein
MGNIAEQQMNVAGYEGDFWVEFLSGRFHGGG